MIFQFYSIDVDDILDIKKYLLKKMFTIIFEYINFFY